MAEMMQSMAVSAVIKSLGEIATERFTCGGTILTPPKVQLVYLNKTGLWSGATFPGLQTADFLQILESSTVASFGKGKETVTDKNYRDAYALDPEKFVSSFQLSESGILGEIRVCLVPDVLNIRAALYKMNVYTAPTGCFKAHVDTPRGGDMFGSLVVCLPSQFTGGALVTRHNGQQVTYDWSSPADNPTTNIQWAAFFSDVEHEILPVTEGHRVTLTYNLYHCAPEFNPGVDVTNSPFYSNLKAALEHPHFLREGGVLGFACQHAYVFEELGKSPAWQILKGSDRTVLLAAKSLGLKVGVEPIVGDKEYGGEGFFYNSRGFSYSDQSWWWMIGHDPTISDPQEQNWKMFFEEDGFKDASDITWCQKFKQKVPAYAAPHYGNEMSSDTCYMAAAILVHVPPWSERRIGPPTQDNCKC